MEDMTFAGLQGRRGAGKEGGGRKEEGGRGREEGWRREDGRKEDGREGGRSHFAVNLTGKVHHFSSSFLTPAIRAWNYKHIKPFFTLSPIQYLTFNISKVWPLTNFFLELSGDETVATSAIHCLCLPVGCFKFEAKLVMADFVHFKPAAINIT